MLFWTKSVTYFIAEDAFAEGLPNLFIEAGELHSLKESRKWMALPLELTFSEYIRIQTRENPLP